MEHFYVLDQDHCCFCYKIQCSVGVHNHSLDPYGGYNQDYFKCIKCKREFGKNLNSKNSKAIYSYKEVSLIDGCLFSDKEYTVKEILE